MMRFIIPIVSRKMLDTPAPMIEPASFKDGRLLVISDDENATISERRITIVECPSEKKSPTATGFLPSWMSLRVVLSIAAI